MESGYFCAGSNVSNGCVACGVDSALECADMCDDHPQCYGWTMQLSTFKCWLKKDTDCKSGPKRDWVRGYY